MGKIALLIGVIVFGLGLPSAPGFAAATTTDFDGKWYVAVDCPDYMENGKRVLGYVLDFPVVVKNGELLGTDGVEGQPGWRKLSGPIARGGKAMLRFDGIISNERHAINEAPRGKPYTYRVRAQFEATKGAGERMGTRKCSFEFKRG